MVLRDPMAHLCLSSSAPCASWGQHILRSLQWEPGCEAEAHTPYVSPDTRGGTAAGSSVAFGGFVERNSRSGAGMGEEEVAAADLLVCKARRVEGVTIVRT